MFFLVECSRQSNANLANFQMLGSTFQEDFVCKASFLVVLLQIHVLSAGRVYRMYSLAVEVGFFTSIWGKPASLPAVLGAVSNPRLSSLKTAFGKERFRAVM